MSIYICSDIHGQFGLYQKMLEDIKLKDNDRLYVLGDMIDRGPGGIDIIKDIMKRPNVICLIGNHELFMLDYFTHGETGSYWTQSNNGGEITRDAFNELQKEEQDNILTFLRSLYLQIEIKVREKTFLLSHSSFLKNKGTVKINEVNYRDVFNTVWDSPWRLWEYVPLSYYEEDQRFHIIGHVPVQYLNENEWPECTIPQMPCPYIDPDSNLINIDLGCARIGAQTDAIPHPCLCCMDLEAYANGHADDVFYFYEPDGL